MKKLVIFLTVLIFLLICAVLKIGYDSNVNKKMQYDLMNSEYYFNGIVIDKKEQVFNFYTYVIYDKETKEEHTVKELFKDDYGNNNMKKYRLKLGDMVIVIQTEYGLFIYDYHR